MLGQEKCQFRSGTLHEHRKMPVEAVFPVDLKAESVNIECFASGVVRYSESGHYVLHEDLYVILADAADAAPLDSGVGSRVYAEHGYRDMAHIGSASSGNKRTALASIGAIGSVLAASSCCLPILPFVFAAGFAGGSALLTVLRPYLLALSVAFVAVGFYQAWRAKQCHCRPNVFNLVLLWTSAVFVILSILFPQVLANVAADLAAR